MCFCRFVKNLKTKQEGWVAAVNILTLIGESKSCQSLTSSGKTPSPCRSVCVCLFLTISSKLWSPCVCLCVFQRAVAQGTSALHPAAVRPTPAPLTSSPEPFPGHIRPPLVSGAERYSTRWWLPQQSSTFSPTQNPTLPLLTQRQAPGLGCWSATSRKCQLMPMFQ